MLVSVMTVLRARVAGSDEYPLLEKRRPCRPYPRPPASVTVRRQIAEKKKNPKARSLCYQMSLSSDVANIYRIVS